MDQPDDPTFRAILKNGRFRRFFASRAVSLVGDSVVATALAVSVTEQKASAVWLGGLSKVGSLTSLVPRGCGRSLMLIERSHRACDAAAGGGSELLSADLEHSLHWLDAEEGRTSEVQYYLLVRYASGVSEALAACYPVPASAAYRRYAAWDVPLGERTKALSEGRAPGPVREASVGTVARLREMLPVSVTGTLAVVAPGSVYSGIITRTGTTPSRRQEALDALLREAEQLAAEFRLPVVEVGAVCDDADQDVHEVLLARGYAPTTIGADAVLDAFYGNLDEYVASFRANRRKVLRKERQRFLAAGPVVEMLGADGLTADLVDLQLERYRRYGFSSDANAVSDRFARAAQIPGLKVLRADCETGSLGFVAFYFVAFYEDHRHGRLVPRLGAFARSDAACYFNLAYYELIVHASRLGGMRIHYGANTYDAKVLRGCRLVRLTTYFRAREPELQHVIQNAAGLRTRLEETALAEHDRPCRSPMAQSRTPRPPPAGPVSPTPAGGAGDMA